MSSVRILPSAWACLQQIKASVTSDFGAATARKVTDGILDHIKTLESFPDVGTFTPDPWLNSLGFRMLVTNRRSATIYRKINDEIFIYYIADTQRDYTKLFKTHLNESVLR